MVVLVVSHPTSALYLRSSVTVGTPCMVPGLTHWRASLPAAIGSASLPEGFLRATPRKLFCVHGSQQSQESQHRTNPPPPAPLPSIPPAKMPRAGIQTNQPQPSVYLPWQEGLPNGPQRPGELARSCAITDCISGIRFNKQKLQVLQLHLNFRQK